MMYHVKRCLVKDSKVIRALLHARFEELELSSREIVKRANAKGEMMADCTLCRYLKHGNIKGSLTQENIIFLCKEYGIKLELKASREK